MEKTTFAQWAIIELFGHQRIAGRVTEQTIGGCSFVRVDVPAVGKEQAFTKLFGQGAIYAITFTDEQASTLAAEAMQDDGTEVRALLPRLRLEAGDRLEVARQPGVEGDIKRGPGGDLRHEFLQSSAGDHGMSTQGRQQV